MGQRLADASNPAGDVHKFALTAPLPTAAAPRCARPTHLADTITIIVTIPMTITITVTITIAIT